MVETLRGLLQAACVSPPRGEGAPCLTVQPRPRVPEGDASLVTVGLIFLRCVIDGSYDAFDAVGINKRYHVQSG